ncbi:hypothetical protein D9M72_643110 [compost metagenome]
MGRNARLPRTRKIVARTTITVHTRFAGGPDGTPETNIGGKRPAMKIRSATAIVNPVGGMVSRPGAPITVFTSDASSQPGQSPPYAQ